ncbi:MAG: hypothetical protein VX313_06505, partial [Bacteroidota bacterium]|nr:hypothetical protein [Bacteroidota bacterium]
MDRPTDTQGLESGVNNTVLSNYKLIWVWSSRCHHIQIAMKDRVCRVHERLQEISVGNYLTNFNSRQGLIAWVEPKRFA